MKKFYNELMVWQEEKGVEGGCLTLFEGYSPTTFGKLVLSTRFGTFSNKTVDVVDGIKVATATDEQIRTLAFFLSHSGVFACDGRVVYRISAEIQNYFDPTKSECIRRGYEDKMWLSYDSTYHGIRIGLVSGTAGTIPNVFLFFDLTDHCWYFDSLGQGLLCCTEVQAASGDVPILQVGGGIADGFIYQLNYGINDVTSAVDAYAQIEIDGGGYFIELSEFLFRVLSQAAGNVLLSIWANDISKIADKSLSQVAAYTGQRVTRHLVPMGLTDQHFTIKLRHNTVSEDFRLLDWAVTLREWEGR